MTKRHITDLDVEPVSEIEIDGIEIIFDEESDKIEIYRLDTHGHRAEGGSFDRNAFLDHVLAFYNANF